MNLFHVFIVTRSDKTKEDVQNALSETQDWIRYYETCYVVETDKTAVYWSKKLQPLASHVFVCRLDKTHYDGLMNEKFWKWYQPKLATK